MNYWIEALKEFNKGKGSFCIVKRDTDEYKEVKQLMEEMKKNNNKVNNKANDKTNVKANKKSNK
jgi:hypothetical protein